MNLNKDINFLDAIFDTTVKCSCIVDDFYSIENLVSSDIQKRNCGFMAYRVVKPPIEIEFQLCCSIELKSIKIWPRINSLKSTAFEIFVSSEKTSSTYSKVASRFNLLEDGIQFTNNISNNSDEQQFALVPFYPSVKNLLRKVKNVKIVIKQTAKCVPVIRKIEIWGNVSKFSSKDQQENVQNKLNQMNGQTDFRSTSQPTETESNHEISMTNAEQLSSSIIPDEFLDAITYEIMALPMVLPSGKTVDNSTLLKHTENEEKWGRIASDPFTGIPFTDSKKPILNVYLKTQIDSFLLKNCHVSEVSTLPRTVGSTLKRRIDSNDETSRVDKMQKNLLSLAKFDCNPCQSSGSPSTSSPSSSSLSPMKSTQIRHQTLDETISKVLQARNVKYTASNKDDDQNLNKCSQCGENASTTLYQITSCSHLICRYCLNSKKICSCGNSFSNTDINKYHNRNIL